MIMENSNEFIELLFFDTFAHDNTEEINLDLVQFPKPVYITEVRIIPLGARVQADFPGGVRLGATNPSQFKIEFFVNDLGKPGASTFENIGGFEYNQNGCINLECSKDETIRKIPTDGLVLRGWYTTITLAVYGTLTKNIAEQIIQPVVNPPVVPSQSSLVEAQQILSNTHLETEWPNDNLSVPIEYDQSSQSYQQSYSQPEPYQPEYQEYYADPPKDPRNYHMENAEWNKVCHRSSEGSERDRSQELYEKTNTIEREHRSDSDKRERDKVYSTGHARERDRQHREYRGSPRDNDHDRDRERTRDRQYKHEECRRSYCRSDDKDREDRKRPRTPPSVSPKRPKTPHDTKEVSAEIEKEQKVEDLHDKKGLKSTTEEKDSITISEETSKVDVEEFEPILSDEDILDDNEQFHDLIDDFGDIGDCDELVRLFIPGSTELIAHISTKPYTISQDSLELSENLKIIVGICDDYFKSSITNYIVEDFNKLNTEIKEEFIHLCEKLSSTMGTVEKFILIAEVYNEIQKIESHKWTDMDIEVSDQIKYIFETTINWLKIALNYDLANSQEQPIYKIRHIKCGLRIAQFCFESQVLVHHLLNQGFDIHGTLFDLYQQEYMAPSIKLMILKVLDTCLIHKYSMERFLKISIENSGKQNGHMIGIEINYYKKLLNDLRNNTSVRLKFSLCSILKKIHLYEIFIDFKSTLQKLNNSSANISSMDINSMSQFLDQILQYFQNDQFTLTQPRRFLPVAAQFEIVRDHGKDILVEYFKMFDFLESLAFLLTHSLLSNLPIIKIPILEVISHLSKTPKGIQYLASSSEFMNILIKYLLQSEEEIQYSIQNGIDMKSHSLGITLAYELRTYYHVARLLDDSQYSSFDLSSIDIINELHALFCLTLSAGGKIALASVLGMTENFRAIIQFINLKEKLESQFSKLKKSPAILYIIDLVYNVLLYSSNIHILQRYGREILHLINFSGQQDVCSIKLNKINSYLAPFSNKKITYDNISPFVEIISRT